MPTIFPTIEHILLPDNPDDLAVCRVHSIDGAHFYWIGPDDKSGSWELMNETYAAMTLFPETIRQLGVLFARLEPIPNPSDDTGPGQ